VTGDTFWPATFSPRTNLNRLRTGATPRRPPHTNQAPRLVAPSVDLADASVHARS